MIKSKIDFYDLNQLKGALNQEKQNLVYLIDSNLENHYNLFFQNISGHKIFIDTDENHKTLQNFEFIINKLIQINVTRETVLVAIGGGSCSDIAGFIASVFKRGINWICIPTTLLSMIDASIGGKVGININEYKNAVGSFYPPQKIYINQLFLNTLDKQELESGIGEILKYCYLNESINEKFELSINNFKDLINKNKCEHSLSEILKDCIDFKLNVIDKDPYDDDLRKTLNLGHTFGHAIELKYKLKHGVSVIIGMMFIFDFYEKHTLKNDLIFKLERLGINDLTQKYLSIKKELKKDSFLFNDILDTMKKDKKNSQDNIFLICPEKIGQVSIKKIDHDSFYKKTQGFIL